MLWQKQRNLSELKKSLSRSDILRRSRILIIDDERPDIIDDLKKARFSVDYEADITKDNMHIIETLTYDLILLDFGNVGRAFGADEGLSLLRYIRHVNHNVVVLAYTSKALSTCYADFYRLTDGVLAKDAGIGETVERVEEGLRKANSIENLWSALLKVTGIQPGSEEDKKLQDNFVRALKTEKGRNTLKKNIMNFVNDDGTKSMVNLIITKLLEIGLSALIGL